jgi:anti-sigma regulatory factor (Ser/Thr protein kinase)
VRSDRAGGVSRYEWRQVQAVVTVDFVTNPATVRMVRKLGAAASRIEGATDLEAFLIEVAIGEVLAQGRSEHNGEAGSVTMRMELTRSRFIVSVTEHDSARQRAMPTNVHADYELGWGLYIIAQVMDEVEIRNSVGQTSELRLVKRLGENRLAKEGE